MVEKLFISYSTKDPEHLIRAIVEDVDDGMGYEVWHDSDLSAGQQWWDEILERIRACDVFLPIVSMNWAASNPCLREAEYARACRRHLVPVVCDDVQPSRLPEFIGRTEFVDYRRADKAAALKLNRALRQLPPAGPLPDPLPTPPPVPIAYLHSISSRIRSPEPLSLEEQYGLVHRIKAHARSDPSDTAAAMELLAALRSRYDVAAAVLPEVDAALAQLRGTPGPETAGGEVEPPPAPPEREDEAEPAGWSPPPDAGPPPPRWVGPQRAAPRGGRVVALVATGLVAALILALVVLLATRSTGGADWRGDDFEGASLDTASWSASPTGGVDQRDGALRLSVGDVESSFVRSTCSLAGDFDVHGSYRFDVGPTAGVAKVGIYAVEADAVVFRTTGEAEVRAGGNFNDLGPGQPLVGDVPVSGSSGELRLERKGSTLTAYVREGGAAAWQPAFSGRSTSTPPTSVRLQLWRDADSGAQANVAFESFVIDSGRCR